MKRSRRRKSLKVTADGHGVVSHAGSRLLADLAERSGLGADRVVNVGNGVCAPFQPEGPRYQPG